MISKRFLSKYKFQQKLKTTRGLVGSPCSTITDTTNCTKISTSSLASSSLNCGNNNNNLVRYFENNDHHSSMPTTIILNGMKTEQPQRQKNNTSNNHNTSMTFHQNNDCNYDHSDKRRLLQSRIQEYNHLSNFMMMSHKSLLTSVLYSHSNYSSSNTNPKHHLFTIHHFLSTMPPTSHTNNNHKDDNPTNNSHPTTLTSSNSRSSRIKSSTQQKFQKGATSLKDLIQKYGWTFVGTYFTVWISVFTTVFALIDSGILDPSIVGDVHLPSVWPVGGGETNDAMATTTTINHETNHHHDPSNTTVLEDTNHQEEAKSSVKVLSTFLSKFEWTKEYATIVEKNVTISNLAISFVLTKLTEPIRIPIVIGLVPKVNRFFGRKDIEDEEDEDSNKNTNDDYVKK